MLLVLLCCCASATAAAAMARLVGELDLRTAAPNTTAVQAGINALPGFRSSAAFFTFLRANLVVLPTRSAMSSSSPTPVLAASSPQGIPSPSPQALDPAPNADSLAGVPPLTTYVLTTTNNRLAGLKLIADSVAQQRQTASTAIIFHPLTCAIWVVVVAIIYRLIYRVPGDSGLVLTTAAGCTMAMLVAVRSLTGSYLTAAERITWDFLKNPETGTEDLLVGTRFGDEIIGVLALRLEPSPDNSSGTGKKRGLRATHNAKGGKGLIRAWTVRLRFRHKGIGTGLLEEGVRIVRERLGRDAAIGFATDHANSKVVLPKLFNGPLRKREVMAIQMLEDVIDTVDEKKR